MMETIGSLIRYIVIIIFVSTLLEMLLPQGVFRRYLRMLVGILLILTLLTPLQKIMHIAPYWDVPTLTGSTDKAGLSDILQNGKEMYKGNMNLVLQEYRYRIFSTLENELASEFGQKLLRLEVSMEENPESRDFGTLENIYAEVQGEHEGAGVKQDKKMEEIKITVEIPDRQENASEAEAGGAGEEPAGTGEVAPGSESTTVRVGGSEKELRMNRFIAAYFQLPSEKVEVKILP